jgi:hypothetical protein
VAQKAKMTFGIVLGNADQIIQATDRRLMASGKIFDDSSGKAGHILCDDATLLYCFTGIAIVGRNKTTSKWLLEALSYNAKKGTHSYGSITDGLAETATEFFNASKYLGSLPAEGRRLTIMVTGYSADGYIVSDLISNFQDFVNFVDHPIPLSQFTVHREISNAPAKDNPTLIQAIGQFGALTATDEKELRVLLESRAPAEAIRQKAIHLIQEISDRPQSHGSVGKKINTAQLRRETPFTPIAGYASDKIEKEIHLLDQVNLCTGVPDLLVSEVKLAANVPVVFPRVHRNAPCPCGSGKRYRECHRP